MNDWVNKCLFNVLFICHRGIFLRSPNCNVPTKDHIWWSSFYYHWKAWLWFHQGTDRHAADKQRRKNCKVTFAAVLRIGANHCFHSSNFFRGHVHVGIEWRDFTGQISLRWHRCFFFVFYNTFLLIYTNFLCTYFNVIVGGA